jgi:predicted dehydrogenase
MGATARIGVVGAGWWATEAHIPSLIEHQNAEVTALCDVDMERLTSAAHHYGIGATYNDLDAMLEQEVLDGVVIATSNASHHQIALKAIDAGLHVLIEKPMTEIAPEGLELLEAAKRAGTQILVGHTFHYTSIAQRARQLVIDGAIGSVELAQSLFATSAINDPLVYGMWDASGFQGPWHFPVHGPTGQNFLSYGQGQNQLTHSAALLAFVIDEGPAAVHAYMSNVDGGIDAVDALSVRFTGGVIGTLASVGTKPAGETDHHELRIFGSQGYLELDMERTAALNLQCSDGTSSCFHEGDPSLRYPLRSPAQNLVDVVLGRATNLSPGSIAQWAVEIVDAAYRSASSGDAVEISDLYRDGEAPPPVTL